MLVPLVSPCPASSFVYKMRENKPQHKRFPVCWTKSRTMTSNKMWTTERKLDFFLDVLMRLFLENPFKSCIVNKHQCTFRTAAAITSLICLYVLIKSTESFLNGAVAGSRKVWGIRLWNGNRAEIRTKIGISWYSYYIKL